MITQISQLKYAKSDRKHSSRRSGMKSYKKAVSRAERRNQAKLIAESMD